MENYYQYVFNNWIWAIYLNGLESFIYLPEGNELDLIFQDYLQL